jgi:hypothetical protein
MTGLIIKIQIGKNGRSKHEQPTFSFAAAGGDAKRQSSPVILFSFCTG